MASLPGRRGRPSKYREFDELYEASPPEMRRPRYVKGIGVRRGTRGDTVWIKVQLPHGGLWKGRAYGPGDAVEIKLGRKASISWDDAIQHHADLQARADTNRPLEDSPPVLFREFAAQWMERAKGRTIRFATDETNLRVHILPYFGQRLLAAITPAEVNKWVSAGLRTRAVSTVRRELNTLKVYGVSAYETGLGY